MHYRAPQPGLDRMEPVPGHPLVVGYFPKQPDIVLLTAAEWADALGVELYVAYADEARVAVEEFQDGTVRHAPVDPDLDEDCDTRERRMVQAVSEVLNDRALGWEFRYLAGRPDRALTHLARTVDASAIIIGDSRPGAGRRWHTFVDGSVASNLTRHQHRPVLVVPLTVVDWKDSTSW